MKRILIGLVILQIVGCAGTGVLHEAKYLQLEDASMGPVQMTFLSEKGCQSAVDGFRQLPKYAKQNDPDFYRKLTSDPKAVAMYTSLRCSTENRSGGLIYAGSMLMGNTPIITVETQRKESCEMIGKIVDASNESGKTFSGCVRK